MDVVLDVPPDDTSEEIQLRHQSRDSAKSDGSSVAMRQKLLSNARWRANKQVQRLRKIEEKMLLDDFTKHRYWVDSSWFSSVFSFLIFLNAACIGVDLELSAENGQSPPSMIIIETVFLICFWFELACRLLSYGPRKFFCHDPWGPFDSGVTLLGSLDAWLLTPALGDGEMPAELSGLGVLRTLRLLRLVRIIRLFRHFSQLMLILRKIVGAFRALFWVILLLAFAVYIGAVASLTLLNCSKDDSFEIQRICRGVGWTLFYHLMLVTAEGYAEYLVDPTVVLSVAWYPYWMFLVFMLNFFLVNLMVGIIAQKTLADKDEEESEHMHFVHEAESFRRTCLTLFEVNDANKDGVLDSEELVELVKSKKMMDIMNAFGIKTDVGWHILSTILGANDERPLTPGRFFEACVRVCGASRNIRSFMLQHDVAKMNQEATNCISRMMCFNDGQADTGEATSESKEVASYMSRAMLNGDGKADTAGGAFKPKHADRDRGVDRDRFVASAAVAVKDAPTVLPSKSTTVCSASLGSGFNKNFALKAELAKKRLSLLEHRQEEMLLSLGELRQALFGPSGSICCPGGHLLMPLGTAFHPVGNSEYRHWTCDGAGKAGTCRTGSAATSHLGDLRRYHCKACHYDLCEPCYQHRLWGGRPPPEPVCCPRGHPLMSLGKEVCTPENVAYKNWNCDGSGNDGGCKKGSPHRAGDGITPWRRYHCKSCRYDLCESCYRRRLWDRELQPAQKENVLEVLSWFPSSMPLHESPPKPLLPMASHA